jgi:hypothetical protein
VVHAFEHDDGVADDFVRLAAFQVSREADAAGVVLKFGAVQAAPERSGLVGLVRHGNKSFTRGKEKFGSTKRRKSGQTNRKSFSALPPFIVRLAKIVKKKFGKNAIQRNKILFKVNSGFRKKWSWNYAKGLFWEKHKIGLEIRANSLPKMQNHTICGMCNRRF